MRVTKVLGVALLALGLLIVVFRGFTYTEERHSADLGPLEIEVEERERVNVPLWLGVVFAIAGGGLLLLPARR
ncbi:MAG TPA: hypothetical protein VM737_11285 [Gemmatimonadota bacterium]|nr:hypothetical protein [Gemmatimonadota bacterium]